MLSDPTMTLLLNLNLAADDLWAYITLHDLTRDEREALKEMDARYGVIKSMSRSIALLRVAELRSAWHSETEGF